MPLQPGARLGPYEVLSALGAGGMGEVWRARDPRLGRDVALKVLPEAFVADPERLARFQREAKVLASLNHPHIGGIHGLEEADGVKALVLELVEGPTLADRIARGAIPIDEALPIARQIAEALEAAHEQGIVHRDLKPANIKVKPDGTVKVLDFGLAKALEPQIAAAQADLSQSPTLSLSAAATQMGVILGTAAYMAPEQARGRPVDKRADVWAFGCLLYEMLAGHRAFAGTDASDTLAYVLTKDIDWNVVPRDVPSSVHRLLRRCLERDVRQRLRDIGEARIVLSEVGGLHDVDHVEHAATSPGVVRRPILAWTIAALMSIVAAAAVWMANAPTAPTSRAVTRFAIHLPANQRLNLAGDNPIALSPDGTRLAYTAMDDRGTMLYVRRLDQIEAAPVPGTEGARHPFFSPDSEWVGFFAGGKLEKVGLSGGEPQPICDAAQVPMGATWGSKGTIVFAPEEGVGLRRVQASGGATEQVTKLDVEKGETAHGSPQFLPNGGAVLFTIRTGSDARAAVKSLRDGSQRTLDQLGSAGGAWFAPTGHLVFARGSGLWAAAFDPDRLEVLGPPFFVSGNVYSRGEVGRSVGVALSASGSLAHVPSTKDDTLGWVDRAGRFTALRQGRGLEHPRLSPDDSRVALTVEAEGHLDIWLLDLRRGAFGPLVAGAANFEPVWTPDGKSVTFTSGGSGGKLDLFEVPADGGADADLLYAGDNVEFAGSWSPDGRALAFYERNPTGARDIWLLRRDGDSIPLVRTPANEHSPMFSPDGRWLAYVSDTEGQEEVYVREAQGSGAPWTVSQGGGGSEPVWSSNGGELFYRNGDRVMRVTVETEPAFVASTPEPLFAGPYRRTPNFGGINYDVSSDAQRFLLIREEPVVEIHVVLNWVEDLARLAATR